MLGGIGLVEALGPLGVKVKEIDMEDLEVDRCQVTLHLRYKRKSMVAFTESITGAIREVPGVRRITFES